jgi:hypothetical protein
VIPEDIEDLEISIVLGEWCSTLGSDRFYPPIAPGSLGERVPYSVWSTSIRRQVRLLNGRKVPLLHSSKLEDGAPRRALPSLQSEVVERSSALSR